MKIINSPQCRPSYVSFILFKISIVAVAYLQNTSSCDDRRDGNTNKKSKQENVYFDRVQFVTTLNIFLSWPCLTKPPIVHGVSSCQLWFVHWGGWSEWSLITGSWSRLAPRPSEHLSFISNWSSRLLSASVNAVIQLDLGWRLPLEYERKFAAELF